jgi:hypothetical protein
MDQIYHPEPLADSAKYEIPEEGAAETRESLMETLRGVSEVTCKDDGHATRSVHAKSHGPLVGEVQVLANLPSGYAQGLFAEPGSCPVAMRFMRVRKMAYAMSAHFRADHNHEPIVEPRNPESIPA